MHRLLIALTLATAIGGCTADSGAEGILVVKNVAPPPGTVCQFTATEIEPFLSHGTLEVGVSAAYLFTAQMKSRITAMAGQEDQRTVITQEADIDISFPNSTLFSPAELTAMQQSGQTHFAELFAAPIAPNGGITDAGFTLIPTTLADAVHTKLAAITPPPTVEAQATFTVVGTMSSERVTSNPFTYAVTMGIGVVLRNLGTCPRPLGTVPLNEPNPCNIAQDGFVDCCTDMNGMLVCPATVSTM
jgi:hypothetical protein